ncbi:hypothetical protein TL16_g08505 [Triparma laevis f. inornata]|uniref:Uncharacterized protein n=1 Tax=Triparma laevis f. inornata TaxID=1714386 RepID=A0A9W7B664_9STRA|nr:hypothetical protein TL16_g08505 [Triparma laevis f. inornata]
MPPTVIAFVGIPASGKSTAATNLFSSSIPSSSSSSPSYISFDAIEASLNKTRSPETWKEARNLTLRTITETLTNQPTLKYLIVDDTSHLRSMRKNLVNAVKKSGVSCRLLWCYVSTGLSVALDRDGKRKEGESVGEETIVKIFEGMQEPGSTGRDGVPTFERNNVLKISGEDAIDGSDIFKKIEEITTFTVEPEDDSEVDDSDSDDLPPLPFNPDPVLRTLVSACVAILKTYAKKANSTRKMLLKGGSDVLTSEQSTIEAFSAQMPEIEFDELLKNYEISKWGGISDKTNTLADGKKVFTDKVRRAARSEVTSWQRMIILSF